MTGVEVNAAAAGSWRLGDLTVSRLGFGAMRLTGHAAFGHGASRDRGQALSVLRRAVALGVNHIDTAAFYFSPLRSANELINSALAPYPDNLVIATKVGPGRDPSGAWLPWARPEQLRGQVEENLRQLGRDHLDLVNLRAYGPGPVGEHFGALAELRQAGLIRHLGVSSVRPGQLAEAQAVAPVVCVQNRFSLDERSAAAHEFVRACGEQGIAFVPYFAIAGAGRESGAGGGAGASGTSTGGTGPAGTGPAGTGPAGTGAAGTGAAGTGPAGTGAAGTGAAVQAVADAHGVTPAQVRLAWTLNLGPHLLAIPGTGDPGHLAENVAAAALRLTPDEMAQLAAP